MHRVAVRFRSIILWPLVCLALFASGGACATGETADENVDQSAGSLERADLPEAFRRVVIARVYQHADWTLPSADSYHPELSLVERRVRYVCDAVAKLNPTYVSGLLRIDATEVVSEEQKTVYKKIRKCIRDAVKTHPVRFDVVLNAKHYTLDAVDEDTGREELKARIDELSDDLQPDLWFFDFFSVPFNEEPEEHRHWHEEVMQAGIHHIKDDKKGLVGGNVWGLDLPPGADFVALDNFARHPETGECGDGFDYVRKQAATFRGQVPVLMHVENNPQKEGSFGLKWIDNGIDYRKAVVRHHAKGQDESGYSYMYPVFFPLHFVPPPPPASPDDPPADPKMESYDARQDGDMLGVVGDLMDHEANRGHATADGHHWGEACEPTGKLDDRFFDARFYLDVNPDLATAFGNDLEKAKQHWKDFGRSEGRTGSAAFSIGFYRWVNGDVDMAFPVPDNADVFHQWIAFGIGEARVSSPVFSVDHYLALNPDLVEVLGEMNYGAALRHYLDHGLDEGRRGSPWFDPRWYLEQNPDVAAAYGASNYRGAVVHWLAHGAAEGRPGAPPQ